MCNGPVLDRQTLVKEDINLQQCGCVSWHPDKQPQANHLIPQLPSPGPFQMKKPLQCPPKATKVSPISELNPSQSAALVGLTTSPLVCDLPPHSGVSKGPRARKRCPPGTNSSRRSCREKNASPAKHARGCQIPGLQIHRNTSCLISDLVDLVDLLGGGGR